MNIAFLDLQAQYKQIKREVDSAIKRVMKSQRFILGEELKQFELEFATYLGCTYAVGVGSGTDGLILALRALDIKKGDEVIVQANSFIASALAITQVGATPVFVDVQEDTLQIDLHDVKKKITKKTKAILAVHLFGAPCDLAGLKKITKKNKLFLIEDSAQAHGAKVNDTKVGTFGDIGVFSFYPGKNLGAYGDGGCIVTNNRNYYKKILLLRNYGQSKKYFHDSIGLNSRLDEMQASVLRVKLPYLDSWNKKRNRNANLYNKYLSGVQTLPIYQNTISNYHLFVIITDKRDALQKYLASKNISTLIHYPLPIHLQKCYQNLGYKKGDLPVAETMAGKILSLPMYAELSEKEIIYIAKQIRLFQNEVI